MKKPKSADMNRLLHYRGSMTRLFIRRHQSLTVAVLKHHLAAPLPSESKQLGLPFKQLAIVREIIMQCDGVPYLFARTIMPVSTLKGRYRRLHRLGVLPIGKLLFKDPAVTRSDFDIMRIEGDDPLLQSMSCPLQACWARRSRFHLPHGDILMTEVYLPDMEDALCH